MEDVKVRGSGGVVVPAFLTGLGIGVVLTLLRRHRGALGNFIGRQVKGEADHPMDGSAIAASDEIPTHSTGSGDDAAKAVAGTLTQS